MAIGVLALALALAVHGGAAGRVQTAASQAEMTPARALGLLQEGNARFLAGTTLRRDLLAELREMRRGAVPVRGRARLHRFPRAGRAHFDARIGNLFVGRVAGDTVDDELLGSLEFATKVAGARLVVLLGHTQCGAVKGACDGVELGALTRTLALLQPAVAAARETVRGKHDSSNPEFVAAVTEANVRLGARAMLERSPILAQLVREGRLQVVPAIYEIETGRVRFLAGETR